MMVVVKWGSNDGISWCWFDGGQDDYGKELVSKQQYKATHITCKSSPSLCKSEDYFVPARLPFHIVHLVNVQSLSLHLLGCRFGVSLDTGIQSAFSYSKSTYFALSPYCAPP